MMLSTMFAPCDSCRNQEVRFLILIISYNLNQISFLKNIIFMLHTFVFLPCFIKRNCVYNRWFVFGHMLLFFNNLLITKKHFSSFISRISYAYAGLFILYKIGATHLKIIVLCLQYL
jgi:hypothetical protein